MAQQPCLWVQQKLCWRTPPLPGTEPDTSNLPFCQACLTSYLVAVLAGTDLTEYLQRGPALP